MCERKRCSVSRASSGEARFYVRAREQLLLPAAPGRAWSQASSLLAVEAERLHSPPFVPAARLSSATSEGQQHSKLFSRGRAVAMLDADCQLGQFLVPSPPQNVIATSAAERGRGSRSESAGSNTLSTGSTTLLIHWQQHPLEATPTGSNIHWKQQRWRWSRSPSPHLQYQ